ASFRSAVAPPRAFSPSAAILQESRRTSAVSDSGNRGHTSVDRTAQPGILFRGLSQEVSGMRRRARSVIYIAVVAFPGLFQPGHAQSAGPAAPVRDNSTQ